MRLVAQGLQRAVARGAAGTPAELPGSAAIAASGGPEPARTPASAPADVVRHMVAMQGQDLRQVLRAIAIRSAPGTTIADVRAAFDRGELARSWAMRGTLFVAAPEDLAVLHAAVAGRMRRQEWRMCTDRGIDEAVAARAASTLVEFLAAGPRPRAELLAAWDAAGIDVAGGRGYHLLALCAYDELVRFGPFDGEAQLLIGGPPALVPDREAGLDAALVRFAAARGPMAADDAAWWTGPPKTLVRVALARSSELEPVTVDSEPMLVAADAAPGRRSGVRLLPGFDEWVLGYRDRSYTASPAMLQAMVPGGNGVFKPVVLVDGRAVGVWRWPPQQGARQAEPVLDLVEDVAPASRARIERALADWPHR